MYKSISILLVFTLMVLLVSFGKTDAATNAPRITTSTLPKQYSCPYDWKLNNGRCYKLYEIGFTTDHGINYCAAQVAGGRLAMIRDASDKMLLQRFVNRAGPTIRLSAVLNESINNYVWPLDNSSIPSDLWCPGSPKNNNPCVSLQWVSATSTCLVDLNCSAINSVFCEFNATLTSLSTSILHTECSYTDSNQDYIGKLNVTKSGRTCQGWDLQKPHNHRFLLPAGSENYCRNPDNEAKAWCYTTDPKVRWEYCDVPKCDTECSYTDSNQDYIGKLNVTKSGRTCQGWDLQKPHNHRFLLPAGSENYCRNPDNEAKAWCYTTDPKVRWEYCDVPKCAVQYSCPYDWKLNNGRCYRLYEERFTTADGINHCAAQGAGGRLAMIRDASDKMLLQSFVNRTGLTIRLSGELNSFNNYVWPLDNSPIPSDLWCPGPTNNTNAMFYRYPYVSLSFSATSICLVGVPYSAQNWIFCEFNATLTSTSPSPSTS